MAKIKKADFSVMKPNMEDKELIKKHIVNQGTSVPESLVGNPEDDFDMPRSARTRNEIPDED